MNKERPFRILIVEDEPLTIFHPIDTWKRRDVTNFSAEKLQHTIVKNGELVYTFPTLLELREFSKGELSKFWEEYLRLDMPHVYKVDLSKKLHALKTELIDKTRKTDKKGEE